MSQIVAALAKNLERKNRLPERPPEALSGARVWRKRYGAMGATEFHGWTAEGGHGVGLSQKLLSYKDGIRVARPVGNPPVPKWQRRLTVTQMNLKTCTAQSCRKPALMAAR